MKTSLWAVYLIALGSTGPTWEDYSSIIMATTEEIIREEKEDDFEVEAEFSAAPSTSGQFEIIDSSEKSINLILSSMHRQPARCDSELRYMLEENALQALTEESILKKPRLSYCSDGVAEDTDFLSLTFPRKLWKIVESEQFRSIQWDDGGNCVVIDEEFFKKEVLERKGSFRIFETDCMKSFIRQLNLYGFNKIRQDYQRSASLAEFLVEEKMSAALSKLQFYHNSNFRRDYPHLIGRMKRRVGIKNALPINCLPELDSTSTPPPSEGPSDSQKCIPVTDSDIQQNNPPNSSISNETQKSMLQKPSISQRPMNTMNRFGNGHTVPLGTAMRQSEHGPVEHTTKMNQLTHGHPPQHGSHNQANSHVVDSSTSTSATSVYQLLPPLAGFGPMMGLPGFQTMYPELVAMRAHLASLLPFCNPWFSMPMMAAASAISMSGSSHHHRTPAHHLHCPNCNCSSSSGPSTRGNLRNTDNTGPHRT